MNTALFVTWFMLFTCVGLTAVAVQGVYRGWLPNGPNGYKRGKGVWRAQQPFGFWLFFCIYFCGGAGVAVHSIMVLLGKASPLAVG